MNRLLRRPPSDLPLDQDPSGRFLPWLVAVMVFLLSLTIAGLFILEAVTSRWDENIAGSLTIQLAPVTHAEMTAEERAAADSGRLDRLMRLLAETPGIETAEALSDATLSAMLEPWIGRSDLISDLPIPKIIELTLSRSVPINLDQLEETLIRELPGAHLDDHRLWLERLDDLADYVEAVGIGLVGLVMAATVIAVVFVTRSGLELHRDIIELLHLMGAKDSYIARQFARHAMSLGLKGGVAGLGLVTPCLILMGLLFGRFDALIAAVFSAPLFWVCLALLPLLAAGIGRMTARRTVLRVLRHML